ncbi:MAG: hypothetical protein IJZ63_04240 [Clostridia bacterium]|nr:hypothetical protein [Clostridia bacterium]
MTKTNSKIIKDAYRKYLDSSYYDLYDCYSSCSYAKREAMDYCKELANEYLGYNLKIIGFNTSTFSVGFIGQMDGKKIFVYITKNLNRYCFIDTLEE